MAGKGDKIPGYNHIKFVAGYENINWRHNNSETHLSKNEILQKLKDERFNLSMLINAGGQDTSHVEKRIDSLLSMLNDIEGTNK